MANPGASRDLRDRAGLFLCERTERMKWLCLSLGAVMLGHLPMAADTIYQINAQGKQVIYQRDAIVVDEDSSSITYKHFDLPERRVVKVRLSKGSLPYIVDTSSAEDRQQIVGIWKRFGYKATVIDQAGKITQVFDAYIDYYPPGGRGSLLESVPATTHFPLLLANGAADVIEFSKIDRIDIQGDVFRITLREGPVQQGKYLYPTTNPVEARFLGITDKYNPASDEVFDFSMPLLQLKQISFQ
jgi:hypothetical protein